MDEFVGREGHTTDSPSIIALFSGILGVRKPKKMPETKPQLERLKPRGRIAIGVADSFPVVLIEAGKSALGVLVAQRCCPGEILENVLYFRSVMGRPFARFFKTVELLTIERFSVAQPQGEEEIFREPSSVPYAVEYVLEGEYQQFVDDVCAYRCERVEKFVATLFANSPGFSIDERHRLKAPANYANAKEHFAGHYALVKPRKPKKKTV